LIQHRKAENEPIAKKKFRPGKGHPEQIFFFLQISFTDKRLSLPDRHKFRSGCNYFHVVQANAYAAGHKLVFPDQVKMRYAEIPYVTAYCRSRAAQLI
jgi:hypothetical protein